MVDILNSRFLETVGMSGYSVCHAIYLQGLVKLGTSFSTAYHFEICSAWYREQFFISVCRMHGFVQKHLLATSLSFSLKNLLLVIANIGEWVSYQPYSVAGSIDM